MPRRSASLAPTPRAFLPAPQAQGEEADAAVVGELVFASLAPIIRLGHAALAIWRRAGQPAALVAIGGRPYTDSTSVVDSVPVSSTSTVVDREAAELPCMETVDLCCICGIRRGGFGGVWLCPSVRTAISRAWS